MSDTNLQQQALIPAEKQQRLQRLDQVRALVAQAKNGDPEAAGKLRHLLETDWDTWQETADLEQRTADVLLEQVAAPGNVLAAELFRVKVQQLKMELAGSDPSPIELALA